MSSRRILYDSSSSEVSFQNPSAPSRRRLPSPPSGILRNSSNKHVTIIDPSTITRRVDRIADNLEDTSRNLKNVDSKLTDFKDLHDDSMSALTKLQEDLEGSLHRLRNTRERRSQYREPQSLHRSDLHSRRSASTSRSGRQSPAQQYESDVTDNNGRRSYRRPSSSLGFSRQTQGDGYSTSLYDKIHDLSSNQAKLEDDLSDEITRRRRSERSMRESEDIAKSASAADRVERRLKEIERGMNAERNHATQLASNVATDLLRRSQSKLQEDDLINRNRLMQVETSKRAVEGELEATRRRLEQSEGGREALLSQIGELRSLINRSDKERAELQRRVEQHEIQERLKQEKEAEDRKRLAASERQDRERLRQENEIEELRVALKRSAGVVQLDEIRRELEKSERQRQQLSDHIEVLTKDLEKKEQAHARVLNQHHDLQRSYDQSERERERLCGQLEESLKKFKDLARNTDKYSEDLRKTEELKRTTEKDLDEMRSAAQDTIRQWKSKCRKQEKEIERLKESMEQINMKNEEILKENIAGKTQTNNAYQQIENLRKEMDDLISTRADMDERLRRREAELEQVSEEKRMLVKQGKDAMENSENLERKLRDIFDKLSVTNQKLCKSEKEVESMTSLYNTAKQQTSDVQHEMRELKLHCNELDSALGSLRREKATSEQSTDEANKQLQAMKVELSAVHKQLQIERETHKKELKDLHCEIHAGEVQRMDVVQKVSKKADEERVFLEGEIHRVNVEANEAKASARESQRLLAKVKEELSLVEKDGKEMETEISHWRAKYQTLKSTLQSKCSDLSREGGKVQRLEDDLLWSRDHVRRLEQLIESANELLSQDICELEAIFELKSQDGSLRNSFSESFDRKSSLKSDAWIASLRKRLDLIKNEAWSKRDERKDLLEELKERKQKIKEMCRSMDEDRRQLMNEVTEQNKVVDCLTKEKTSLLLENKEARMIVHDLEDRVTNLTADLENESKKERERIQERYNKYKDTIDSLQAELEDSRNRVRAMSPSKRVTMANTTPIIHGYSPIRPHSSSPRYLPEKDR